MLTRFCYRQVFGNKDGNPTLSTSTNIDDNDDNDFFALAEIQAARRVALNGARGLTGKLSIYLSYVH